MKRGTLFAFLCAFTVGIMALTLVAGAFVRPQIFQQLFFSHKLFEWNLSNEEERTNAEIVNDVNHAVVTVVAMRAVTASEARSGANPSAPEGSIQRGTGTGFIIDLAGLIVTNEHVIRNADRIRVRLADGRERKANVLGIDTATDIALLKIEADNLDVLEFGDSDAVQVGDPVIAIGNPLEYEHTVTAGIVSALGRKVYGDQPYENFIQTDAAINRGNSGGPLLNKAGEVVGVNTVIRVDSRGISFAVPSNVVKEVVEQLRTTGEVARGFLGLRPETLTPEFREGLGLTNTQGVVVSYVTPDTPAARAGIQAYDVITHFDSRQIRHSDDFFNFVAGTRPYQQVEVALIRAGQKMTVRAVLGRRPPNANDRQNESRPSIQRTNLPLGFAVRELTPESQQASNDDKQVAVKGGVIISDIDPLGPAAEMRWLSGYIITEANRQPVHSLADFQRITANLRDGNALVMRVILPNQRDGRLVALRIGEGR